MRRRQSDGLDLPLFVVFRTFLIFKIFFSFFGILSLWLNSQFYHFEGNRDVTCTGFVAPFLKIQL